MTLSGDEQNLTGLAVAIGRVEEKLNAQSNERVNDIAFQQSARDTFTDHEKRITAIESNFKMFQWLTPILVTVGVFAASWVSDLLLK